MTADIATRFDLGDVDQIGYVVSDIEQAIPRFAQLFGECTRMDSTAADTVFRGKKSDVTLKLAFFRSGPIEIELIEPVSGAGPHQEFLDNGGEGTHHVRFRVTDLDAKLPELNAAGYETVWYSRFTPEIAWAYLETPRPEGGGVFELLEMP
ncbi:MAG: VOC family protein [Deltaproteobacteria bacterium]|nr:VOC family protein [Deltaproteobacteria bacterium]MBW2362472.1 VOC family protein [Deltaproteobacteria bacterium]